MRAIGGMRGSGGVAGSLIHRATIERKGAATRGELLEVVSEYGPHLTGAPCRLGQPGGGERWRPETQVTEGATDVIYLMPDADVTDNDRVVSVVDIKGRRVGEGPWRIGRVDTLYSDGPHHKYAVLESEP